MKRGVVQPQTCVQPILETKSGHERSLKSRNKKLPGYSKNYVKHACFKKHNYELGAIRLCCHICNKIRKVATNPTFPLNFNFCPLERQIWLIVVSCQHASQPTLLPLPRHALVHFHVIPLSSRSVFVHLARNNWKRTRQVKITARYDQSNPTKQITKIPQM